MRATADVEQDAVRRIDGDQRRVALALFGEFVEQARVGSGILHKYREIGMHGACFGERETWPQPAPFRRRIYGDEPLDIALFAGDYQRRSFVRVMQPLPHD